MDANSFLMGGGGAPTAKFPTPGTTVGGRITEQPKVEQQRDIQSGELKFWSDGNPMMQLVVTVQTDERDPSVEDDDGRRRIFVKGQMKNAVADAVRQAGAKGLEVGGTLHVRYTHDGTPKQRGFSAPKQYAAKYTPAAQAELAAPAPAAAAAPAQGGDPWATNAAPAGVNTTTGEISDPPPF
ncbi:hypothetical protein [Streptomyces pseudogriseolus]|uniref:hypothetical protein n=1 Tax=Streptomyces pseudogriseolus TaxID=36817 RepID=UPI00369A01CC